MEAKFELGQLVITPGAQAQIPEEDVRRAVTQHMCGDWGETCEEDAAQNDFAVAKGDRRIFSVYKSGDITFWIITEQDRSSTCILLPEEY